MIIDKCARFLRVALTLVAFVAVGAPGTATAQSSVAVSFFYEDLSPYGYWVRHPYYGTVWYPARRSPDWQPYLDGYWLYTAEYGWYWESDEDWAWATYHYGRWVYTAEYGWVWVPGDDWGPAWVEWRYSSGYMGWAPMPPEATWRSGAVVYVGADANLPQPPASWVFVSEADFARGQTRRIPSSRNAAMLSASSRVGGYSVVNSRIVNRGADVARIAAATNVRIIPAAVVKTQSRTGARVPGRISVYQPRVVAKGDVGLPARVESQTQFQPEERLPRPSIPQVGGSVGGPVDLPRGGGVGGIGGGGIGGGGIGGVRIGR